MKEHISTCLNLFEKENILGDQVTWEYLNYEVRKFSIKFSKGQEQRNLDWKGSCYKKTKKLGK